MFHPDNLISDKEDGVTFARGFYGTGKDLLVCVNEAVRKLVEKCESLKGFLIHHSFSGGTGSGFSSLLLRSLNEQYGLNTVFNFVLK